MSLNISPRSLSWTIFFYFIIGVYLSIQLYGLAYWPLPWFDETYFASMAWHFIHKGKLIPQVAVFEEVKLYGFVYFLLTGLSMKWAGFSILSFRIVNFLFGFGCIGLITLIARALMPQNRRVLYWLPILLALDPFFNLSLHEGRMDLTALFFMLVGLRQIQVALPKARILYFMLAGFWMNLSLLTSPRAGFILLSIGAFLVYWTTRKFSQRWPAILSWGISLVGLYSIWVVYAFGDWLSLLAYYLQPSHQVHQGNSLYDLFVGWNGYIPKAEYPLIIFTGVATLWGFLRKPSQYNQPLIMIMGLSILLFYFLIFDYGPYSIYILPFYYILFFYGLHTQGFQWRNPILYLGIMLSIFNLSYFSLKNLQAYTSKPQRSFCKAREFVQTYIPPGSKVVGEPMYYYAVKQAGSDFQYLNYFETLEERSERQFQDYPLEYLIITDQVKQREPDVVAHYLRKGTFAKIARLEIPLSSSSQWVEELGLLSSTESSGYNAVIYLRLD